MAGIELDVSELREFAVDLGDIPQELSRHALPAFEQGGKEVRDRMREDMASSGSFGHLSRSITMDPPTDGEGGYEIEIGPTKKFSGQKKQPRHGANIAYFGTYKGGGTVRDPKEAAEEVMPSVERRIGDAIERLLS